MYICKMLFTEINKCILYSTKIEGAKNVSNTF